jgi:hypothetical protein
MRQESSGGPHKLFANATSQLLTGAVMLVPGVGQSGLWIAVIAVGIAIVAFDQLRARRPHPTP